ncbi:hypothetical protein GOP47_0022830 [Adiantum capillus-veneris]|uniref:Uncharacterized protein n=1 Tax=Adiantum capillus-veneris TaxID=13818 RepID=A0A9D4Z787_ADICA|nr:hypothetical protein GOP47_0022830 [Adiantum capillus-veneris]
MARGKRSRVREEEEEAGSPEVAQEAKKAKEDEEKRGEEPGNLEAEERPEIRESTEDDEEAASRELHISRCKAVLQVLMDHKYAWLFSEPVDPVALEIPDYPTIVKHPMDLGTIMAKLNRKEYGDLPLNFIQDVRLTFDNAMLYNPPGHEVNNSAKKMLAFFHKEWDKSATRSLAVSTPRTPRHSAVSVKAFSFEDKQILLENLQTLPPHMQYAAVLLMSERSPHVDWSGDEVDVQLDLLDNQLLQELENHVKKCMKSSTSSSKKVKQTLGSSKSHGKGKQRKGKGKVDEEGEEEEEIGFVIDVPLSLFPAQKTK